MISRVDFKAVSYADLHYKFFYTTGTVNTIGRVSNIESKIIFKDFNPQDPKPYIDIKVQGFTYDEAKWQIYVDFDYIPNFIANIIIELIQTKLLEIIISNVVEALNHFGGDLVNNLTRQYYPMELDTDYSLGLSTYLVDRPDIKNEYAYLKVDGTFYDKNTGYRRTGDPQSIELDHSNDYKTNLFISEYTLNTLFVALYGKDINITWNDITFRTKVNQAQNFVEITNKQITITAFEFELNIIYKETNLVAYVCLNSLLSLKSTNFAERTVELRVEYINFDRFEIKGNIPYVEYLSVPVRLAIMAVLIKYDTFTFSLPQFDLPLDLSLTKLDIKMFDRNVRAGVELIVRIDDDMIRQSVEKLELGKSN